MKFIERFSRKPVQSQSIDASQAPLLMALEPRIMFDASVGVVAQDAAAQTTVDAAKDSTSSNEASPAQAAAADTGQSGQRHEVVFVDSQVSNAGKLLEGLPANTEIVVLDPNKDGLQQMADYLKGREGLDAIHLLSHGADGTVQMGNVWLASNNLAEHRAALESIGAALKADGDLMLYGCDVGQGEKGQAFLNQLASITGADVAASVDDTGAAALGGNWTLERSSGSIETSALNLTTYDSLMAVTFTGGQEPSSPVLGPTAASLMRMVVGDFNNDGRDDILYQDNTNVWRFAAGQADGTFLTFLADQAGSPFSGMSLPSAATNGVNYHAADFDGDGDTDLLVAAISGPQLTLFRNNNGVFSPEVISGGPLYGNRTIVGDFNGDGAADLLYQTTSSPNAPWRVMMNDGNGNMTDIAITDASSPFRNVALPDFILYQYRIADVDGDGDVDLIHLYANTSMTYFRNDNGVFTTGSLVGINSPLPQTRYVVADFDGDGDADILFQFSGFPNDWQFYRNDGTDGTGNPTFTLLDKEDADSPIKGLNMVNMSSQNYRVGDFDGDGDLDMFASSLNVAGSVYWQSGSSPKLISATPADDTLNVSPGANIVLTFDRSVNPGSGSIQLVRLSDGQVTTIAASSVEVSGSGTTWTINPASNLDQGAAYAVRISPKAFVSTDGKAYEGIANNTALNFNTSSVQAPVISNLNGDSVTFTEGTPGTLLDAGSNASVTDADSLNFNGGNVTVTISNGQASQDVLWINTDGNGAGSISTSGNDVLYGGVVIGTYAGGTLGNPLVISLNSAATPAAVSGLLRNLSYRNTDLDNPNTAARTVQITVNDGAGGTSSVASVQVNVTAVNDAPVVSVTGSAPTYTEGGSAVLLFSGASVNTVEPGQSINQMVFSITNLSNGSFEKLVIDGTDVTLTDATNVTTSGNGTTVQVSVSGSTATVTVTHAGISAATAQSILNSMAYRNDSQGPSGSPRVVTVETVRDSGGTANGGVDARTVSVSSTVTLVAVNDAPTLSGGPYVMTGINEDTATSGHLVSSVLGNVSYTDVDPGALAGIAVTATSGRGTWQYSTDGSNWTDFGTVSSSSALLLSATTQVRYIPDGANGESVNFTFRAWDRSTGTASTAGSRSLGDTTTNGGSTAFSTGTAQATLVVSSVNDAPVMTPVSPTLSPLTDSSTANFGDLVGSLTGGTTDVDTGAVKGIAITGLTSTYGTWQYSIDAGTTWNTIGTVSSTSALILRPSDRVRFVPDGIHGETATITYKAWDQTGGTAGLQGVKLSTSASGGTSAFSTATDTASVVVTAVNDAPTLNGTGGNVAWTEGNNTTSIPVVIDSGLTITDADGPVIASATVRVSGNYSNGQDYLELISNPATMGNVTASWDATTGTLTLTSAGNQASLAQFQAALRAVTYTNLSDAPSTSTRTVQFQVNDGNLDSSGFSRNITVTAVDDSPVITAPANTVVVEDVASVINLISISDSDSTSGTVTLSVGSGSLAATSAAGVTVGGTSSALTLTGTLTAINSFIASNRLTYTTAANATADVTLTIAVDTGSISADTKTMTLRVNPVNDAPVVTVPGSITVTEDVASVLSGISFSDVDAGSASVTVGFSVPSGTLLATDGGGVIVTGSGTGVLTLSGALANINVFIAASNLTYKTAQDATGSVALTVSINDNGNTGGGPQTDTKTVTLNVTAVNDAPVNSVPASQTAQQGIPLAFNDANGNAISISDVDAGSSLMIVTLSSVNGTMSLGNTSGVTLVIGSGTDNTVIRLQGTQANINAVLQTLTFKSNTGFLGNANLTIQSNDLGNSGSGGAKSDIDTIAISVIPLNPKVTSVSAQGLDRTVKIGDEVLVNVVFDQAVNVDLTGGVPSLLLETGLIDRNAVYQSGSGSNTLVFKYTVQAGDVSADLDFQSTAALQLNGAVLANATSDLAILTLPTVGGADSLGGRSNIVVDAVVPVVASVSVPSDGTYITGQNLDFTVNFSENMVVDTTGGVPRIAVTLDTGGTVYADYVSGSGGSALVFRLTAASGQLDSNGVTLGGAIQLNGGTLRDTAGNDTVVTLNNIASTANVNIDGVAPTVVSVTTPANGSYKAGDVLTFTVNASEALQTGALAPRLTLDVGGVTRYATYVSGSGSSALVFQYVVQAGDNDNNGIAVNTIDLRGEPLTDLAGNNMNLTLNSVGSTAGVLVDTVAPSPTGIVTVDPSPTNSGSVSFTITFDEDVSGVDTGDFVLALSGTANGTITSATRIDGRTWTVVVGNLSGVGNLGLNLNGSGTGIVDAANNSVTGGLTGATYAIDRVAPSVTGVDVPSNGTYVAGQTLDFTVRTDEAVLVDNGNGNPRLAITLDNGRVVYAEYLSGSGGNGLVFRLNVTSGMSGNTTFAVAQSIDLNGGSIRDASGNDANAGLNNVGDTRGILVDAKAPRPSSIVVDGPVQPTDRTLNFTLTFDEAVSGVDLNDFSVISTGSASGTVQSVQQIDAQTYRITVGSMSGAGTLALSLNALNSGIQDQVGNDLTVSLVGQPQTLQPQTVQSQGAGDLNFRLNPPDTLNTPQTALVQPQVPGFVATDAVSPLVAPGLFDVRTVGGSLQPLGTIFLGNGSSAPSFIAQVFGSSDGGIGGSQGGFGGGEGSVFGSSTFAGIFSRDVPGVSEMNVFNGSQWKQSDLNQGLRGVFGAPTFGQQLHQINEADQRHVRELAMALAQPTQIGKRA
ncbi:hypothetical protein GCM10009504_12330 [Pseudomonas laurentiana]|nr:DUF4347 domain-containing protein [Pseudomonas laurentiana]GGU56886.1 hypothetical protein GCM10009504_12330 [Pseudomonas laurentiana]